MKGNVERVLERDQKLSQLDDRADALQQGASQFETQAAKLKRKYVLNRRVIFFLNDTELLRLPHYQIRQTIAQSKRLDDYISGKPNKNSQKILRLRNF